ncbi:MAG: Hsp70 family protein [Methylococcales bacterium]
MATIIGIDLGTTNSEVAVVEDGQPRIITDKAGNKMLPSVVGMGLDNEILVGEAALNQYALYPERTIKSIKRSMGFAQKVEMAGEAYSPQEISAIILRRLKEIAEADLQQSLSQAVVTVPAYFNDAQRQATRDAGEIAGLDVVRIINEPTAAALSYEAAAKQGKRILIYDLGGGTFDVSVVEMQGGVVEVLASHGDNHLGGDDFDQRIMEFIREELVYRYGIQLSQLKNARQVEAKLLRAAVAAKEKLSSQPFACIEAEYLTMWKDAPFNLSLEISRDEYEVMITSYIDKTLDAVHRAMKDSGLSPAALDEILLVGGSTRTPLVSWRLKEALGIEPRCEVDPDFCVATGAAIQAAMIAGEKVSSVLVDITLYTFGTSIYGDLDGIPYAHQYVPIIRKNTPIPAKKSEVFFTIEDNQKTVDIKIYQGEDPDALKNSLIGEFTVEGLSKSQAPSPIVMTLDLDLDGILHVVATEKKTGLAKSVEIKNAAIRMESGVFESAQKRVAGLFGTEKAYESNSGIPGDIQILLKKADELGETACDEDREVLERLSKEISEKLIRSEPGDLQVLIVQLTDIVEFLKY